MAVLTSAVLLFVLLACLVAVGATVLLGLGCWVDRAAGAVGTVLLVLVWTLQH
jgi:hypothetical protein